LEYAAGANCYSAIQPQPDQHALHRKHNGRYANEQANRDASTSNQYAYIQLNPHRSSIRYSAE